MEHRAVERTQMFGVFITTYSSWSGPRDMCFFVALLATDLSASQLTATAVDTLSCAHIGQLSQSVPLITKARESYGSLLRSLASAVDQREMSRSRTRTPFSDREVLTSVMLVALLGLYEHPIPISQKREFFLRHYKGAQLYLDAKGPECLDWQIPIDRIIYQNLKTNALLSGLAREKPDVLDGPAWTGYTKELISSTVYGKGAEFHATLEPIPELLKRIDQACQQSKEDQSLDTTLLAELRDLRRALGSWMPERCRLESVHVTNEDEFDNDVEEHCFVTCSNTFTSFYRFKGEALARIQVIRWMVCLIVECSILRLITAQPKLDDTSSAKQEAKARALEIAKGLCRGVWFVSTMSSLAYAKLCTVFIGMAQTVFQECGLAAAKEFGWTQACLLATGVRMSRLERQGQQTLCCVHELGPGLADACRWQIQKRTRSRRGP